MPRAPDEDRKQVLSGSALGQTTSNKITLDANTAGHNWFIDATPYQNEEWFPTSNPDEWAAKPGSAHSPEQQGGSGFRRSEATEKA